MAVLPSSLGSLGVDGTAEDAVDGAQVATQHRTITGSCDDVDNDEDDYGTDGKRSDVDWNSPRRGGGFPSIHTALVVVTADMVAATAQIGEGDCSGTVASTTTATTTQCVTSSYSDVGSHVVVASLAAESISDDAHSTSSAVTENMSTTTAATEQT